MATRLKEDTERSLSETSAPVDGIDEVGINLRKPGADYLPCTPLTDDASALWWRESWLAMHEPFLVGPSLSIRTVDTEAPFVPASLRVETNGEEWTSRCPGGYYHRYLTRAGRHRVKVGRGRFMNITLTDNVRRSMDIVLKDGQYMKRCETP